MCELELKQAFWVATQTRNLILVKKLAEQGAMVSFGKEAIIRTQDGTLPPLVCTSDDLYTLHVLPSVCIFGARALPVERLPGIAHGSGGQKGWSPWLGSHAAQSRTLGQGHRALSHNNFNDVARRTKLVDGMHIGKDGAAGHCDTCAHKSTNHGVSTRCVAKMAFGRSTERLTLQKQNGKIERVCLGNSRLMLWLHLSISKTNFPLCAQEYAV